MGIWTFETSSHGWAGAHIEQGLVSVDQMREVGTPCPPAIVVCTPDQALEMAEALQRVAYEIRRREMNRKLRCETITATRQPSRNSAGSLSVTIGPSIRS